MVSPINFKQMCIFFSTRTHDLKVISQSLCIKLLAFCKKPEFNNACHQDEETIINLCDLYDNWNLNIY